MATDRDYGSFSEGKKKTAKSKGKGDAPNASILDTLKPDLYNDVVRLARMPEEQCAKALTRVATQHDKFPNFVESCVREYRKDPRGHNRATKIFDDVLWPHSVNAAELLGEIGTLLRRFIVFGVESDAIVVALWIFHAHALNAFVYSPRLFISAPTSECGKTILLTLVSMLSPRAHDSIRTTEAALARISDTLQPTVLLDEVDKFMTDSDHLHALIDKGHCRYRAQRTILVKGTGGEWIPHKQQLWAALAMAGTKEFRMPRSIKSRTIEIFLKRRRPNEKIEKLREEKIWALCKTLREKLGRFAVDNFDILTDAKPDIPKELYNRNEDNWSSLFAIADVAGTDWSSKARQAALALLVVDDSGEEELDRGVILLGDIREIFVRRNEPKFLKSEDIARDLINMKDRIWSQFTVDDDGTPTRMMRQMSSLLKPFKIGPKTLRVSKDKTIRGSTAKGYLRASFVDDWERYLPPIQDQHQGDIDDDVRDTESATSEENDQDQNERKAATRGSHVGNGFGPDALALLNRRSA